jgi:hypothetical protein
MEANTIPTSTWGFVFQALEFLAAFFIFFLGLCVLVVIVTYVINVTQTKQAIRRNYPVIAHFCYFFEEMPFNRNAARSLAKHLPD